MRFLNTNYSVAWETGMYTKSYSYDKFILKNIVGSPPFVIVKYIVIFSAYTIIMLDFKKTNSSSFI